MATQHRLRRRALSDSFEVQKTQLRSILEDVDAGRLQLPNFQRTWKWPDELIRSLMDSIGEGYPIGSLMFIETGGDVRFDYLPISGVDRGAIAGTQPGHLVMDGQQRITAMYQTLYAQGPVSINAKRRRPEYRRYFFDMRKAIEGGSDLIDALVTVVVDEAGRPLRKGAADYSDHDVLCEEMLFPLNFMFRFREWEECFDAYYEARENRYEARGVLSDFRDGVVDAFTNSMVPVIALRRGTSLKAVSRIYEKLNTGGVPLESFDLLIARFAADGFNLREDWKGEESGGVSRLLEAAGKGLLQGLTPSTFLSTIHMLVSIRAGKVPNAEKDAILGLTVEQYKSARNDVVNGFKAALRFLRRLRIWSRKDMPAMAVVSALAAVLAHLGRAAEDHVADEKITRWFWCVTFSNIYARSNSSPVGADVHELVKWLTEPGRSAPRSVTEVYLVDKQITQTSGKKSPNIHKAIGISLMLRDVADFCTGRTVSEHNAIDEGYDMHHIFPKKWCIEAGLPQDVYDSVVNRTPMSSRTNRRIGAKPPSQYIAEMEACYSISPEKMDRIIESHGIDPAHLREDRFEEFFIAREAYITAMVEERIGKPLVRSETLEASPQETSPDMLPEEAQYRLSSRGAVGYAVRGADNTAIVLAGSIMSSDTNPSLRQVYLDFRKSLIDSGKAEPMEDGRWRLREPIVMNSMSAAASILSGKISASYHWQDVAEAGVTGDLFDGR